MKKLLSLMLVAVMLLTLAPTTALARNAYIAFDPVEGCRMNSISFTQADNPWLLWDVAFKEADGETVLKTAKNHPNLVSAQVIPSIDFEGTSATFNGTPIVEGEAVTLLAENEIVITDAINHNFAEYTLIVTEKTNGLPVVLIDTDGAPILTKTEYVPAHISVIGADVYGADDIYYGAATKDGIKLRGNSTKGYAKKPYRIKFNDKQNVFGLGKAKSWVLLADYLDPSSLRNQVALKLAARINANTAQTTGFQVFAPRMNLVEVYLNGEYKGMYEMGDHMQVDKTRVNINEDGDDTEKDADGNEYQTHPEGNVGYFIEVEVGSRVLDEGKPDSDDWSAYSYITNVGSASGKNQDPDKTDGVNQDALYFQFKLPEVPSDEQIKFITDMMQDVNDLILENNDEVWQKLDMDSVIDWYLVNEIFKNADSQMQSSVYFFRDKDGKLFMGPVWDFDLGAGGVSYGSMDDPTGWRTRNDEYCGWFREMFEMDSFKDAVNARWADLHEKGILDAMYTDIEEKSAMAGKAAVEDFDLWHDKYVEEVNKTDWLTIPAVSEQAKNWETHVDYFKSYLKARIDWMDEQFGYADKTVLSSKRESVDSLTYTAANTGKQSQQYTIDLDVAIDELNYVLDMNSTAKWNVAFNYTVKAKINGQTKTFTLSPATKDDWQTPGGNTFDGTTGAYHAAGSYTDRSFSIAGALVWNLNNRQGAGGVVTKENLSKYVTSIHFNYITLQFENASIGDTATFSLKNGTTDKTVLNIEKTIITGKPSILGDAKSGMTLFVSNTEMLPYKASVTYQWYADGKAISGATGNSYKMTNSDIGKAITVKATGTEAYTGTVTSDAKTVQKYVRTSTYDVNDSNVLKIEKITADSIIVSTTYDNVELSIDGKNWQTDGTFADLTPNTVYGVYIRGSEHTTGSAGVACGPLVVTTLTVETCTGDVNGNGELCTQDAKWILEQALDFADMKNETMLDLADMNGDGKINTLDSRLVLKELVNTL